MSAGSGSRDAFKLDSRIWYRRPDSPRELAAYGPAFAPQLVLLSGHTSPAAAAESTAMARCTRLPTKVGSARST